MKFPRHEVSLFLTHNEYKLSYDTIEVAHSQIEKEEWVTEEERIISLNTGEIWSLQWYPKTAIGFHVIYASSLESIIEFISNRTDSVNY